MQAGIREILIISGPQDILRFQELLKDGSQFGIECSYAVQPSPDGLAQAFLIGEAFIGGGAAAMVLGDNIFEGAGLEQHLKRAVLRAESHEASTIFAYYVDTPKRFGIVEFDTQGRAVSIEEKPERPKSNYCVTGLYFYDSDVVSYVKKLRPSKRKELEITDLNQIYLSEGRLDVEILGPEFIWLDAGTHDSLMDAGNFVRSVERHQHRKIACPEEIAYRNGWIEKETLRAACESMKDNPYGAYLRAVLEEKYQK